MFCVTVSQAVSCHRALKRLADAELPLRAARRVAVIIETVFKEIVAFESLRDSKIKAVGELKEGAEGVYVVREERKEALIRELNELMAEEITILCDKIPEKDLPDDFRISPAEVGSFYAFVEPIE